MAITIVRPGMFTTVQDCGRWGFQARGVPVSGAMDVFSHRLANALVGNVEASATLEATLTGPELQFDAPSTVAIAGAEFRLTLDGEAVAMNRAFAVQAGATLKFGERQKGARAYVAVGGGVAVPMVLGSRATHVITGMGGFDGRALRAGDELRIGSDAVRNIVTRAKAAIALPDGGARLRVIAGTAGVDRLRSLRFIVSARSDRMGYRLDGPNIVEASSGKMISAPVPTGAIQMPPDGQPILLMADHATTGGYPIAATVITADLPLAGQLAPGDWIEFQLCSLEEADAALRDREALLGRA
jgi:antagonist of KipI